MIEERVHEIYDYLVDETENPNTYRDKAKAKMLSTLLEIFEYLLGNENENPVPNIFE